MTTYTIEVVIFSALIYVSASSLSQRVFLNLDDLSFTRGFQLQSGVFYAFEPVGILQCMRECKLRSKCRIIGWRSQRCELGEDVSARSPSTNRKDFVSQPEMWSQSTVRSVVGTCELHKCPNGNKCVQRSNGLSICMTSACPDPPTITSSETPTATKTVGSQFSYVCVDKSAGSGNPNMTCTPDGTWTPTSFSCQSVSQTTEITSSTKQDSGTTIDVTLESETTTEKTDTSKQEETATTVAVSTKQDSGTTIDVTIESETTTEKTDTSKQEETVTTVAVSTKQDSETTIHVTLESETTTEKTDTSKQEETATTAAVSLASDLFQTSETDSVLKTSADRVSRSAFESLTTKQPGCKDSYSTTSLNSKTICYNIYSDVTDTYDGAKTRCEADGAELMIIRSKDKITALKTNSGKVYFVDGSDVISEGVWKHSDGSTVDMSLFKSSPGTDTSKNCVTVKNDKKFHDEDCANANGFICEILVS